MIECRNTYAVKTARARSGRCATGPAAVWLQRESSGLNPERSGHLLRSDRSEPIGAGKGRLERHASLEG